jgi:hypothetical protein
VLLSQHPKYFDSSRFAESNLLFLVVCGETGRGRHWATLRKDLIIFQ